MDSKLCMQIQAKIKLPTEIFDEILVKAIDFEQAITLKRYYVANRIYNPDIHNWYYAALNGNLEIVKFIYEKCKGHCSKYIMDWAAEFGHLEILKWLYEKGLECGYMTMWYAVRYNHLDIVKWLHEKNENLSINMMHNAAECGHLEIVRWLHNNTIELYIDSAMYYAAINGHLEIMKFLYENVSERYTMEDAAEYGNLEIVKFLYNQGECCSQDAIDIADENGYNEIVEFLRENRN